MQFLYLKLFEECY